MISKYNNKRLYFAANRLFRTDDQGHSWKTLSQDLSRMMDRNKLMVMDRVWSVDAIAKMDLPIFMEIVHPLQKINLMKTFYMLEPMMDWFKSQKTVENPGIKLITYRVFLNDPMYIKLLPHNTIAIRFCNI